LQIFEEEEDEPTPGISLVSKNTEMPEGVEFSDGDGKDSDENNDDPHKALGEINLDDLEFHENNKESRRTLISNDSSVPTGKKIHEYPSHPKIHHVHISLYSRIIWSIFKFDKEKEKREKGEKRKEKEKIFF